MSNDAVESMNIATQHMTNGFFIELAKSITLSARDIPEGGTADWEAHYKHVASVLNPAFERLVGPATDENKEMFLKIMCLMAMAVLMSIENKQTRLNYAFHVTECMIDSAEMAVKD